ncbi:SNARE complex subunit (Vam7) [Aspergillus bombycis]|uniref:SNARE complex subunit (Vam7) n=1 Tax=Aspergillus bombycis TaxID=109264 RepID=A0A1F7ZK64_9EURO|nr:SNARE complex subunit (Vam7) [Aspergillus bombycis]OGM39840.1 SNARE complex subunit (Vam7) [Aspergillus bombycis]
MSPNLEITIPTTSLSPTSPPYTVYNLTLRLPLRSFTIAKRYSEFLTFHQTLVTQTNAEPPAPLPSKTWFKNTVSNASLRETRRQALEAYLQAINDADDARWRNSPAWRAFLNLPSAANASHTSTRLHAAITDPGSGAGGANNPITDPTLWLDVYRDMKSHLHDARLHLTRRDQETTPQKQHESSARAKSSLVRAGSLIAALEAGLKVMGETANRAQSPGRRGGDSSLGDGELRRRKDLLINARKEKDGLEDLLNAMAAKSRVDNAVASVQDKEALVGNASRKPARSGRVLGKETERTRELDNQGVLQLQRQTMDDQDQSVEELLKIIRRQKELGIAINEEVEIQNALLSIANEDAERVHRKIDIGKKRIGKIS